MSVRNIFCPDKYTARERGVWVFQQIVHNCWLILASLWLGIQR